MPSTIELAQKRSMPSLCTKPYLPWHCRWFFQRMLDSFRSWEAFSGWAYSQLPSAWNCVVLLMIGHFVKDCIEQFAQAHAHHEHDAQLRTEAVRLKRRQ